MDSILDSIFFIEADEVSTRPMSDKPISLWLVEDDIFRPSTNIKVQGKLDPGLYSVEFSRDYGIYCKQITVCSDELFIFSDSKTETLLSEIDLFWKKSDLYKENKLVHKRGILLEGYPGTGKSSIISLASDRIIKSGGIVFKVEGPSNLVHYISFLKKSFRKIQPTTPIITILEDIDEYSDYESYLLDFLDGKLQIEHHVIIATSNNTVELDDTYLRPSRIDLRIAIDYPSEVVRREYFKFKRVPDTKLEELVVRSEGLSLADLKELYICIFLLEYSIDEAFSKILHTIHKQDYTEVKGKYKSMSI